MCGPAQTSHLSVEGSVAFFSSLDGMSRPLSVWKTNDCWVSSIREGQSAPPGLPADIRFANGFAERPEELQSGPTSRSDTVHKLVTLGFPRPSV